MYLVGLWTGDHLNIWSGPPRFSSWPLSCANAWLSTPSRALRTELIADRCLTEAFFFYAKSFLLFSFAGFQVFQLSSVPISNDHHISLRNEHYIMCFFSLILFSKRESEHCWVFFQPKTSGNFHQEFFLEKTGYSLAQVGWDCYQPWSHEVFFNENKNGVSPKFHGLNKPSLYIIMQFLYIKIIIKLCRKDWINFGSMNYPFQVLGKSTCGSNHWRHIDKTWDPHQSQHETWSPSSIFIHTDICIYSPYIYTII